VVRVRVGEHDGVEPLDAARGEEREDHFARTLLARADRVAAAGIDHHRPAAGRLEDTALALADIQEGDRQPVRPVCVDGEPDRQPDQGHEREPGDPFGRKPCTQVDARPVRARDQRQTRVPREARETGEANRGDVRPREALAGGVYLQHGVDQPPGGV